MHIDSNFIATLQDMRKSATFMHINGYKDNHGGVANYSLVFHVNYENVLKRSLAILDGIIVNSEIEQLAKNTLRGRLQSSLDGTAKATHAGAYDDVFFETVVPGVKWHKNNGELHLTAYKVKKNVIVPGVYKQVNSRPITLAVNALKRQLPISNHRQFVLSPGRFDDLKVENCVFTEEDILNDRSNLDDSE